MNNIMHCHICDWSPHVESEFDQHLKSPGCRLVYDDNGGFICTDCLESSEDALSDFLDEEEEDV